MVQAQGFALFDSAASAQNALRHVANLVFEEGATLRCELARKNMYIKDNESSEPLPPSCLSDSYPVPLPAKNSILGGSLVDQACLCLGILQFCSMDNVLSPCLG